MKHFNSEPVSRNRVTKWLSEAQPVSKNPVWYEERLAIDFGGHTFILGQGQVFQCAKCGTYDPDWTVTEVLSYMKQNFPDVEPYTIKIRCSVAVD